MMKTPKTDQSKFSLPGALTVLQTTTTTSNDADKKENRKLLHPPCVHPKTPETVAHPDNIFVTVYDHGPVAATSNESSPWDTFDQVRARLQHQWSQLPPLVPTTTTNASHAADTIISPALSDKVQRVMREQQQRAADMLARVNE